MASSRAAFPAERIEAPASVRVWPHHNTPHHATPHHATPRHTTPHHTTMTTAADTHTQAAHQIKGRAQQQCACTCPCVALESHVVARRSRVKHRPGKVGECKRRRRGGEDTASVMLQLNKVWFLPYPLLYLIRFTPLTPPMDSGRQAVQATAATRARGYAVVGLRRRRPCWVGFRMKANESGTVR